MFKYLVEFIGTFVLLSVIMNSAKGAPAEGGWSALPIAMSLATVIFFGGQVSGGYFNPAVNTMMMMAEEISKKDYIMYNISQILAAVCAYYFHKVTN